MTVTARPTTPGVRVSKTALTVTEEDTTGDSYTVVLSTQPTADVVVMVAGHSGTDVTPSPTTLTFTTSNWSTAQTVTVTAGNDADLTNDTVALTHSAASADANYSGITIDDVTVTVNDNDTAAGICGRTDAVRDALMALVPGASGCADVTAAHLAAITGLLDLSGQNITALAAGDFAGLTALTELDLFNNDLAELPDDVFDRLTSLEILNLNNNDLTELPAGVFDRLTSLEILLLDNNDLTMLPVGVFDRLTSLEILLLDNNDLTMLPARVFDGLTSLETLFLFNNELTTLPDDVFDDLTALKELDLSGNTEAPFAPDAVALPDEGTVSVAGGAVTLDGSGSGGPWGTNVTYFWALNTTASGVTVTFDDDTSAMPVATIPGLPADTELIFTLTVTGRGGTNGIATATDTAKVTATREPGVTVSKTALTVTEEDTTGDSYTVVLDTQPTADVTVTVAVPAGTGVTTNPTTLTFTTSNWNTPRTVTVTAGNDADLTNDTVTLTHRAMSADTHYNGITIDDVTVTVNDNDTAAGICGRTDAVRDALMALVPSASGCADVTAAHLAAITGRLDLSSQNITALAAGDFAGLTELTQLKLNNNKLTTLPEDVFDGLTSLAVLFLSNNELLTLPDGVFERLTALQFLDLSGNPGAPFAPIADARTDDGTVPVAGGKVRLDGSGSGGAWGTNVTYGWALTTSTSGVTVTFDDDTSATPVVTIPAQAEGAELTFTLTVTGRGGSHSIDPATDTATVTATARPTTPGVRVSKTALTVTEEDTTGDSYTVVLSTQPTADVVVMVAGHAGTDVTPYPTSLTFTTLDWSTAQTVTVTAGNDADLTSDTVALTHSAASADANYNGITIDDVTVTVNDNDTAAGICGRTDAVRDALMALVPGASGCADVTAAHLAAITGLLDLSGQNITALAAGDFAGLTALTELDLFNNDLAELPDDVFDRLTSLEILNLNNNDLTELPAGVFDRLTSLEILLLDNNDLTMLPVGVFDRLTSLEILLLDNNDLTMLPARVFDGLTSLETLFLFNNELTTLPDDVFDDLTALKELDLSGNTEAPFAPDAVALPDEGTVSVAGGAVTLDGSGSGGPWGTNVTYFWALNTTASGVTVTFDNDTSPTPVVTIPELPADTELIFTLTVTGRGGTNGIATATDTAKVTATREPGVTVSRTALTVREEDTTGDSYTVVLDTQPTADVTVTVAVPAGTGVTTNPTTLTFTHVELEHAPDGDGDRRQRCGPDERYGHADPPRDERGHRLQRHHDRRRDGDGERQRHRRRHLRAHGCGARRTDGSSPQRQRLRRCHRRPSRRHHRQARPVQPEHHRPRGGGFRRADRADAVEAEQQQADYAARGRVRRADLAGGSVSVQQRAAHAARRGVRAADRAAVSGSVGQSWGALRPHRGCPDR